ncbi:amidohydrolase 3 [Hymenopellis radicata]|nr:amidohydrolase 3 [Hymenopellis radicata]
MHYGLFRQIPLEEGKDIPETVSFVREYILSHPDILEDPDKIVEGWGWDHTAWPEGRFPTAADLDADPIIRGRPIMLRSKDGHGTWVSGRVLDSIQPIPHKVEGGSIIRNEDGEAVGVFLDNAQLLMDDPVLTDLDYERRFSVTVQDAHRHGLTSLHDAKSDFQMIDFFKRKAREGLPIRVYAMTNYDDGEQYWGNLTPPIMLNSDHSSVRAVSNLLVMLYEPYYDNPTTNGFMRVSEKTLNRVIPWFLRDGWQVNVHAIAALSGVNVSALRPRLEHAQIMADVDIKRVGKIGVIASVQPTHVIDDMWYAEDRLGPERIKGLYAFRSLLDAGARLTLGSDFPVETMNPLAGFYAALTRVSLDGRSPHGPGGWFPEQRLTPLEALRGMTIEPAHASFTDDVLGSLEPGKHADFVVLSQNIMEIPVTSIMDTKILATVIDGIPVYGQI